MALKLLLALGKLYGWGYLHNDIKPDNIGIDYIDGTVSDVFFIDYGLSEEFKKQANEITLSGN